MSEKADSKSVFQFLDAQLWVKRVRPNPTIPLVHKAVLSKGGIARYNMRVELKSFTFSSGSQSLSIDNAVLGSILKRLLFTMMNKEFLGSIDTNPFFFRHYDLQNFALYVNGKQIPGGGGCLSFDMSHQKKAVMAYGTFFEGSGIHHSNSGLQITPEMYLNGYFMLRFDITPDRAASEGHLSSR